jgi:hypothetical protein
MPARMTAIVFDLDIVFQTLYEFCTNESVKEHVKAMRDGNGKGLFNSGAVEDELARQATELEPEEGFYYFPIPALLKILYANTDTEDFRVTLKKMNQTAGSIFLDDKLPVEGREELVDAPEVEVTEPAAAESEPSEAAGVEVSAGDLALLSSLVGELNPLLPAGGTEVASEGFTSIPIADRDTIIQTAATSEKLIKNTTSHLTHIMEALSFQDLSGQRIKKIVGLISDIQLQLLSLLVSVNTKIKAHHAAPTVVRPKEETEKVAQAEVDKMLERLSAEPSELKGPGADKRLDQGAVNDLLAQLGF